MTYHYHGIDAEESILNKSLPNLGTWALPNLFFFLTYLPARSAVRFFETVKPVFELLIAERSGVRSHGCRCERSGVRIPGRSNWTQCRQRLAIAATFFRSRR